MLHDFQNTFIELKVALSSTNATKNIFSALTHSHTMTPFDAPRKQWYLLTPLLKTLGKVEIARNGQLLLF